MLFSYIKFYNRKVRISVEETLNELLDQEVAKSSLEEDLIKGPFEPFQKRRLNV
jgi:hypothetical protein